MINHKLHSASVQFDYHSDNFIHFAEDFYKYSNMAIPLSFLVDRILLSMSEAQINYFRLPAKNSNDNRNHFYIFRISMQKDNKQVRTYEYERHVIGN